MNAARAKALPLLVEDPAGVALERLAAPLPRPRKLGKVKARLRCRRLQLAVAPPAPDFDVEGFLALEDDGPGVPGGQAGE